MDTIRGRVFLLNDNVDTDQILPGYAMSYPTEDLKKVTLKGSIIPDFPEKVKQGDIIIAGENFGCGSSREQAPVALKDSGVGAVIAKSFARIFRKNSINIGLPAITCDYINDIINESLDDDEYEINLENGFITNLRTRKRYELNKLSDTILETLEAGGLVNKVRKKLHERGKKLMPKFRPKTEMIIKEDIDRIKAYEKAFGVKMPYVDEDANVQGLPNPYPREVNGVIRSGYRISELGREAVRTGNPILNPILGRNSAEETYNEAHHMYDMAEKLGIKLFHFVHSEATRHIDPLDGIELIEQSRGKGGITPAGEREFVQMGGGSVHPIRINATGDATHINVLNGLIAGFDGTDIGPVIHVHFGGRGIHDFRTKVENGYKAIQICAENNIFVQLDTHKHINNIMGTDGMALAMCLLSEGLAVKAGLDRALSGIQMNVAGINVLVDLALVKAFRETIWSEFIIAVPETFQNPPADLIAEQSHFARMAVTAKLAGANFYRPKAAENVGIPTGESMSKAIWATQNVFEGTYKVDIHDPFVDERKEEIKTEAMAVLTAVLKLDIMLKADQINPEFWDKYDDTELIDLIVEAGKSGILDTPRAGGWDLKRFVKTHRDKDGIRRYVAGYTPLGVDAKYMPVTKEEVEVQKDFEVTRKEKVVLATVGADAHVVGINMVKEAFQNAGFEVIFLRGMNLPETVADVVAETKASVVGVSNLLGLGITLFPRIEKRLIELGLRDDVILLAGGRISEKEEEHVMYEKKMQEEGSAFLGVDRFFGPGTDLNETIKWVDEELKKKNNK